jgi:hypothetical protein
MMQPIERRDSIVINLSGSMSVKPPSPVDNTANCGCTFGGIFNRFRSWTWEQKEN